MGNYTEVKLKVPLKSPLQNDIRDIFRDPIACISKKEGVDPELMCYRDEIQKACSNNPWIPSHPLFTNCERWYVLLWEREKDADGYHLSFLEMEGNTYISLYKTLKNYDDEIELFLDWISAFCSLEEGRVYGEYEATDDYQPRMIRIKSGRFVIDDVEPKSDSFSLPQI